PHSQSGASVRRLELGARILGRVSHVSSLSKQSVNVTVNIDSGVVRTRVDPEVAVPKQSRGPSMHDVAALAGVSHQTVSRVLNNFEGIRPETRERVLEAIDQLGYRRNLAARTL